MPVRRRRPASPSWCPSRSRARSPPIAEAIEQEPRLKAAVRRRARRTASCSTSRRALEGLNRHAGMHAAGVVIAEKPLWEYVPCFRPAGDDDGIVTQFDKDEVEKAGLVKFDFLGLKTLTVIQICAGPRQPRARDARRDAARPRARPARRRRRLQDDLGGRHHRRVPARVVGLPRAAEEAASPTASRTSSPPARSTARARSRAAWSTTSSTASTGARRSSTTTRCSSRSSRTPTASSSTRSRSCRSRSALAGYSLGSADLLRRAMGKKKAEVMAKEKAGFLDGAKQKGVDAKIAERVFDLMEKFAGYGFNRSHSAAYGLLTYQTAYLKRYYPRRVLRGAADLRQGRHRQDRQVHRRGHGQRASRCCGPTSTSRARTSRW